MFETAEDRLAFLDPEEFAVEVTITPASGPARAFLALFEAEGIEVELADGTRVRTTRPTLLARAVDLDGLVDGEVAIAGESRIYRIGNPAQPDGTGFALLELRRDW